MLQRAACPAASYRDAEKLQASYREGRDVRGRGLMLAVELHPEAGRARRYCEALQGKGILAKDTHEHTIRIAPPLVITGDQVDWALEQFATILTQDLS